MTTIATGAETFDIGRVISRTFGALGRNAAPFLILAIVLVGAPAAVLGFVRGQFSQVGAVAGPAMLTNGLLAIVVGLLGIILSALLQAAVIRGVVEDLNGRKASIADCLSMGLGVALPVIAISIMVGLGIFGGAILLLVPGVMLAVRWIVAVPVRVMEGPGVFAAIGRSAKLTQGHRWSIFALLILFAIAAWIVTTAVLAVVVAIAVPGGGLAGAMTSPGYVVMSALVNALTSVIGSAGVAATYCELRAVREGAAPSALAEVFD